MNKKKIFADIAEFTKKLVILIQFFYLFKAKNQML